MNKILWLCLMTIIGGKRGLKTFLSILFNFFFLIVIFYLIACGFSPYIITLIACLFASFLILFFVNGFNDKTKASFFSVLCIFVISILLVTLLTNQLHLGGFGYEEIEEIGMYSFDIHMDMNKVTTAVILLGFLGAIIDASIAISSSLYEVYRHNKKLTDKELFKSGIHIGKDILGTTMNTLFFAYLGYILAHTIYFKFLSYSFFDIINAKVFANEFIKFYLVLMYLCNSYHLLYYKQNIKKINL